MILRIEDLDPGRVRAEFAEGLVEDLGWLGLDWDEVFEQSTRLDDYGAAFDRLRAAGRVYPCFCSRRDVAAAASAPQEPGDELRYPGTCRELDDAVAAGRIEHGQRHCFRFRDGGERSGGFVDAVHGHWGDGVEAGDFVVWRSDGVPAYQLAAVVDDAAMEVSEVVRGDDLLASTVKQLALYRVLELAPPVFAHVPLLVDRGGVRLSKRQRGITLAELRAAGARPQSVVGCLSWLLGLRATPQPLPAAALVEDFDLARLPVAAGGLVVDLETWDLAGSRA